MKKVLFLIAAFAICGSVFAQDAIWPDLGIGVFEDYDPVVAMVRLDNHLITTQDNYSYYEVGAFVGEGENEDYRGHGFMKYYSGDEYPCVAVDIYYNPTYSPNEGKLPVHFKLYDHNTGILYDYFTCTEDILTQEPHSSWDFNVMPIISFFTTTTKEIEGYSADGGWYLITSPLNQEESPEAVLSMTSNNYDLYYFDQTKDLEWINYKPGEGSTNPGFNLVPGKGYLYANSEDVTLTFVGPRYNGDGRVQLTKTDDETVDFQGWNLVGNPFAETAYIDRTEFYVMKSDGTEVITPESNEIGALEGIFVVAAENGEYVTFSTTNANLGKGQIVLNVTQDQGNVIDRAIVRFGQGGTLPKFMLNQNNTKLYIPKDNKDFAVVRSSNSGRLPVNFEPAQDGVYFINVSVENLSNMKYLHLVDHEAGLDFDLLQDPVYKFEAKTNGKPGRFELVFKKSSQFKELFSSNSGISFSFCNNGNWIINNEGDAVLQVIDVNGRILSNEEISGSVSKRIDAAPGVYMLRLINNNDVKVQKIVVE